MKPSAAARRAGPPFSASPSAIPATERRTLALRFGAAGLESATLTERLPEHTLRTRLVEATAGVRQSAARAGRPDRRVRPRRDAAAAHPGLSLAVIKDGKIVKAAGYGVADRKTGAPATPETVYKIGSVSKQFIATGIMLLVQDGRLRVDDPSASTSKGTPASWSGITIRHLLTHTSGIQREAPAFDPWKVQPDIDVVRSAYPLPLRFPTGSKWEYCNTGYFALAEIITRVSGTPWTRLPASEGVRARRDALDLADEHDAGAPGARHRLHRQRQPARRRELDGAAAQRRVPVDRDRPCEVGRAFFRRHAVEGGDPARDVDAGHDSPTAARIPTGSAGPSTP